METFKYIFFWIISAIFLYCNYKIILSDIKEKIIPNAYLKYLLILLPFYCISIFFFSPWFINWWNTHLGLFFIQVVITIIVWFWLYSFWLWSAWDAKYIVVLWLFIPQIGIIPFVWNIALLIILYLFLYFIWFYIGKCIFIKWYAKKIFQSILIDLKEKWYFFIKHSSEERNRIQSIKIVLNWFLIFLFLFISFRLLRLFLIGDLFTNENHSYSWEIFKKYYLYILIGLILISFWTLYIFKKFSLYIQSFLERKFKYRHDKTKLFLPFLLLTILIGFVLFEYQKNPEEIKMYLYKIFTLYISLYLLFKILKYSYHITFQLNEQDYIIIKSLKTGAIVDKEYLIKIFWEQECLWAYWKSWVLSPSPKEYFLNIQNPIDEETKNKLIEIYKIVNTYHLEEKKDSNSRIRDIKILKTFALWGYIFSWFFITFFLWNTIFKFIIWYLISFIFPS